jgi:hypothetical protein
MRYLMYIKSDENHQAGTPPDPKLMAAMDAYIKKYVAKGVVLFTGGLGPSKMATRLVASEGRLNKIDGPFAEAKELIGGFAIVEAESHEQALEWGREFMQVHIDALGPSWKGVSEIFPVFGSEELVPPKK